MMTRTAALLLPGLTKEEDEGGAGWNPEAWQKTTICCQTNYQLLSFISTNHYDLSLLLPGLDIIIGNDDDVHRDM